MNITSYYKLENIVSWIKSWINIFFNPKKFILNIENKDNKELLSQISFYFIIYTAFFIFVNSDFKSEILLKQSTLTIIINAFSLLSVLLVSFIVFGKQKLKTIFLFLISLRLISFPIVLLLHASFIETENYFFEFLNNIFILCLFIYSNYLIVFLICKNWFSISKFLVLNFLFLNGLIFISNAFSIDKNAPVFSSDPILLEYNSFFNKLECKNEIPIALSYTYYKDSIYFGFVLTDVIKDSVSGQSSTDNKEVEVFKNNIQLNINNLNNQEYNFLRNRQIGLEYKKYFDLIQKKTNQEYFYPIDLRDQGYQLHFSGLPRDTILIYIKQINQDDMLIKRQKLVDYHNDYVESIQFAQIPIWILNNIQFSLSELMLDRFFLKRNSEFLIITDYKSME